MLPEPLRFLTVGGVTFVIYFALQYTIERIGAGPYVALSIAYAIAITYHYLMNRIYTFGNRFTLSDTPASLAKYAVVNVLNYGLTLGIVGIVRSFGLDVKVGMVIAIILTSGMTFFIFRYWVFKSNVNFS